MFSRKTNLKKKLYLLTLLISVNIWIKPGILSLNNYSYGNKYIIFKYVLLKLYIKKNVNLIRFKIYIIIITNNNFDRLTFSFGNTISLKIINGNY